MRLGLLLAILLVSGAACDTDTDTIAIRSAAITLYDTEGEVVTTGRLDFEAELSSGSNVLGTYRLDRTPNLPLERSGTLDAYCGTGPAATGQLVVRLGLEVADGGVLLVGRCAGGLQGGVWETGSIAGPMPGGTFEIR